MDAHLRHSAFHSYQMKQGRLQLWGDLSFVRAPIEANVKITWKQETKLLYVYIMCSITFGRLSVGEIHNEPLNPKILCSTKKNCAPCMEVLLLGN